MGSVTSFGLFVTGSTTSFPDVSSNIFVCSSTNTSPVLLSDEDNLSTNMFLISDLFSAVSSIGSCSTNPTGSEIDPSVIWEVSNSWTNEPSRRLGLLLSP